MCPGLKCSCSAKNEEKMEIFPGPMGIFFTPLPYSLMRGGTKLIETHHGITGQSLPWKECLLSVFPLWSIYLSIYLKTGYGHHSEIIHIKRGFKGPNNYPGFITKESHKESLLSNSRKTALLKCSS